jgi:hypothetical protein
MNPAPALQSRFTTWCLHHGASETAASDLWSGLSAHYTEAHRHYHHPVHNLFEVAILCLLDPG